MCGEDGDCAVQVDRPLSSRVCANQGERDPEVLIAMKVVDMITTEIAPLVKQEGEEELGGKSKKKVKIKTPLPVEVEEKTSTGTESDGPASGALRLLLSRIQPGSVEVRSLRSSENRRYLP